jgi:alpha-D-xyloside xylohydrolase
MVEYQQAVKDSIRDWIYPAILVRSTMLTPMEPPNCFGSSWKKNLSSRFDAWWMDASTEIQDNPDMDFGKIVWPDCIGTILKYFKHMRDESEAIFADTWH